jgi:glutathione S-transferase
MTQPLPTTSSTPAAHTTVVGTLYGHPGSTCTSKVQLVLAEKNAEVTFVHVDLARADHKSAEHLARHPFGVIPVYEDARLRLYESDAISRYLARELPGPRLVPTDALAQALMDQWLSVSQCYYVPEVSRMFFEKFLKKTRGLRTDEAALSAALSSVGRSLDVLDRALSERTWLAGDDYSLADIAFVPSTGMLFFLEQAELVTSRPHVCAWWARVRARPSVRKVLDRG